MPELLVPEFIKRLHNRTHGWEDLIHEDAAFTLLMFQGRTVTGRTAIASELNSWKGRLYKPQADRVMRLSDTAALVQGRALYPTTGRGHAAGQVWWVDELCDGLIWRVRGFTGERAARAAYAEGAT